MAVEGGKRLYRRFVSADSRIARVSELNVACLCVPLVRGPFTVAFVWMLDVDRMLLHKIKKTRCHSPLGVSGWGLTQSLSLSVSARLGGSRDGPGVAVGGAVPRVRLRASLGP